MFTVSIFTNGKWSLLETYHADSFHVLFFNTIEDARDRGDRAALDFDGLYRINKPTLKGVIKGMLDELHKLA